MIISKEWSLEAFVNDLFIEQPLSLVGFQYGRFSKGASRKVELLKPESVFQLRSLIKSGKLFIAPNRKLVSTVGIDCILQKNLMLPLCVNLFIEVHTLGICVCCVCFTLPIGVDIVNTKGYNTNSDTNEMLYRYCNSILVPV